MVVLGVIFLKIPMKNIDVHASSTSKIKLMKKTAFLVNCARGPIVDQNALVDALRQRAIAGAAIDVYEREPVSPEHPLLKLKNVIATPHIAGVTYDVRVKAMDALFDDVVSVLTGKAPKNCVNPRAH